MDALVGALGLDPAKSEKVDGYYHELEVGLLDPEPVDRSVWDVLADVLQGERPRARWSPTGASCGAGVSPTCASRRSMQARLSTRAAAPAAAADEGPDEIDRLFTGSA